MKFNWFLVLVLVAGVVGCAENEATSPDSEENLDWGSVAGGKGDIYGTDSRYELNDPAVSQVYRRVAESTALVFSTQSIFDITDSTIRLNPKTMSSKQLTSHGAPLCSSERFASDAAPGFCTAFLIAPDLVATAGHCVNGHTACDRTGFTFDFAKETPGDDGLTIDRDNFYRCSSIVGHHYDRGEQSAQELATGELWYDWAVVKLDRPVAGRAPLDVAFGESPEVGDEIVAVGHPSGLAMKVTKGTVVDASKTRFFNTDLDIYQGNSGSPAVDSDGVVRGIVIRGTGGSSFERTTDGCYVSDVCDAWGDVGCGGNHVLRPEPLRPYQSDDLNIVENHRLISGNVSPSWSDELEITASGPIAFVTVNINGYSRDVKKLSFELTQVGGDSIPLMVRPTKLSGSGRWTRTTFGFNGQSARGTWRLKITDLDGGADASAQWWQVIVGIASDVPADGASVTPWIGSACESDAECGFTESGAAGLCYRFGATEEFGFCTVPCEGYCPDRSGHAGTFCIASDSPQAGICAKQPAASNEFCNSLAGTTQRVEERFIGGSGAPASSREVCAP